MAIILFVGGLALLIAGAELLVRGASQLASSLGVPPLIVGLTIVAFGTSTPELGVSLKSALDGEANIAVGNVVGSNIFNVLFILGLSALVCPLVVSKQLIRLDVPLMIGVSALTWVLAANGSLNRLEGLFFFSGLVVYTTMLFVVGRRSQEKSTPQLRPATRIQPRWTINAGLILLGLVLLVFGSNWLVAGAVRLAELLRVSDLIVGLTIVAAGTSLPEVATSLIASIRGERDIAVGNVVGSNLFNLLGVLGLTAVIAPEGISVVPAVVSFDLPIMTIVAIACLPIFFTGGIISRWEGGLLLGFYGAYVVYLVLTATSHWALPVFSSAMADFIIPLTLLTLFVVSLNSIRRARRHHRTDRGPFS